MKKWLIISVLFLVSLIAVFYGTQASDKSFFLPNVLSGVKIVIDPGHGGIDGGASHGETVERDITLAMSLKLEKELKSKGATVVMTRSKEGRCNCTTYSRCRLSYNSSKKTSRLTSSGRNHK